MAFEFLIELRTGQFWSSVAHVLQNQSSREPLWPWKGEKLLGKRKKKTEEAAKSEVMPEMSRASQKQEGGCSGNSVIRQRKITSANMGRGNQELESYPKFGCFPGQWQ